MKSEYSGSARNGAKQTDAIAGSFGVTESIGF